jgi:hypothetical protein
MLSMVLPFSYLLKLSPFFLKTVDTSMFIVSQKGIRSLSILKFRGWGGYILRRRSVGEVSIGNCSVYTIFSGSITQIRWRLLVCTAFSSLFLPCITGTTLDFLGMELTSYDLSPPRPLKPLLSGSGVYEEKTFMKGFKLAAYLLLPWVLTILIFSLFSFICSSNFIWSILNRSESTDASCSCRMEWADIGIFWILFCLIFISLNF